MESQVHPLLAIAGLFGLGLLHGVGPDHLAALGTLASKRGNLRSAIGVALRFGLGHAALLAVGAAAALLLGFAIPEAFERVAELVGGSIVAILGAAAVVEAVGLRVHSHPHGDDGHSHAHVHLGRSHGEDHPHRHGATLIGALLAVSGLRGLMLLLPTASSGAPVVVGAAVLSFGAGVVVSMVGAAFLGAGAAWMGGRAGLRPSARWVQGVVGATSCTVGVAWMVAAW